MELLINQFIFFFKYQMPLFQNCILLDIPLDLLFFTSFVVLLTDKIFSTMFASSSGGSCGAEREPKNKSK